MNKTLHQKLTNKTLYAHSSTPETLGNLATLSGIRQDIHLMKALSKDLLSPRQEAINRIMEMSRSL